MSGRGVVRIAASVHSQHATELLTVFCDRAVGGVEDPRRQWEPREDGYGTQHREALGDFDDRVGPNPPAALLIHGMQRIEQLGQ
jgi:hypothetical protein